MRTLSLAALLVSLALLASACGSGDDDGAGAVDRLRSLDVATEGARATLAARLDVGTDESGTLAVDWGDGFREEQPVDPGTDEVTLDHDYEDPGEYEVSMTVNVGGNEDSAAVLASVPDPRAATPTTPPTSTPISTATSTATATTTATTTSTGPPNQSPTLAIKSATSPGDLQGVIVFDALDPEGGDLMISVDYGDGFSESIESVGGEFTAVHDYPEAGAYEATVTVEDDRGARVEATTAITVTTSSQ